MSIIDVVRLHKPVEVDGYLKNGHALSGCRYLMGAEDIQNFVKALRETDRLEFIEETLQQLWMKEDGTKTKSSWTSIDEFVEVASSVEGFPQELIDLVESWREKHVVEVMLTFEQKTRQEIEDEGVTL